MTLKSKSLFESIENTSELLEWTYGSARKRKPQAETYVRFKKDAEQTEAEQTEADNIGAKLLKIRDNFNLPKFTHQMDPEQLALAKEYGVDDESFAKFRQKFNAIQRNKKNAVAKPGNPLRPARNMRAKSQGEEPQGEEREALGEAHLRRRSIHQRGDRRTAYSVGRKEVVGLDHRSVLKANPFGSKKRKISPQAKRALMNKRSIGTVGKPAALSGTR